MSPITHVVLLHAAPNANEENIIQVCTTTDRAANKSQYLCANTAQICNDVLALKDICVKETKPYIKSVRGGKDKSIEGQQVGPRFAQQPSKTLHEILK